VIWQGLVTFASALSATILNALWEDALLVLCIALLLRFWPRINAATRYTVWSATLIAAIIVPVVTTVSFFAVPKPQVTPVMTQAATRAAPHAQVSITRVGKTSAAQAQPSALPAAPAPSLPVRLRFTLPASLALAVFAAWILLAAYALVRLILGLTRLEQLKRDALPLPVEYRDAMPQWLRANKGTRDVRLCVSDETDVPVAVGLFDSMILVPHSLLDRLSETEVDQICLHELAHLRRGDDWTNGMQRLIVALLGWNPAAQFIGQQLDLEREVACDDWVLSFVGTVRPYALCLTKMAERASWPRHPIPAPGVFATRKHISVRIERLLGAGRNVATNLALAPAATAIAAVAAVALVIGVVAPSIAAPSVVAANVSPSAPAIGVAAPTHKASPIAHQPAAPEHAQVHEKIRTVIREVPVAAASQPPGTPPLPRTVSIPGMNFSVPQHSVNVSVPAMKVPVPHLDAKRMAQTISSRISQSINTNLSARLSSSQQVAQNFRKCNGCDFAGVDWSGRDMRGVNYTGADLSRARLVGTNFSGGNFTGADFSKADLRNASFRGANLQGCDFTGADLTGVDFRGARISGSQFTRAQLMSTQLREVLNGCNSCDFSGANLRGLDLSNVRLNGDDFSGADLSNANLSGSYFNGVDFAKARLDGANLAGATMNGCDLEGVDLRHVDLSRTRLVGIDLSRGKEPPAPPAPPE
jgi:uncharacterized protein YjbI with pentapeptide repeats/beta-lactamase regulating signal transducer with metallopeptidase domain